MRFSLKPLFLTLSLFVLSCTVGPSYEEPKMELNNQFKSVTEGMNQTEPVNSLWWKSFGDPLLESLVQRSLQSNLSTKIALSRLTEVRSLRRISILDLLPIIRSQNSYENSSRSSKQVGFQSANNNSFDIEYYNIGFDASWEVDFFGRLQSAKLSNDAMVDATVASLNDVLVTVIAEVARNYVELRGLQEQLRIASKNASNQKETVKLTEALQVGGTGTELDVARAKTQLSQTTSLIPTIEFQIRKAKNRIAVLLGQQPGSLDVELDQIQPIPQLKENIKVGNPEQLLKRRPDIKIAERTLASSVAKVGIEKADFFPRVDIFGSFAYIAGKPGEFFDLADRTRSITPTISWAFLDLERVRSKVKGAEAKVEADLADYQQTVLTALEDVENSLTEYSKHQETLVILQEGVKQSELATSLARERYQSGIADFLTVLDSERRALEIQTSLATSATQVATSLISVFKSLGGGWEINEKN